MGLRSIASCAAFTIVSTTCRRSARGREPPLGQAGVQRGSLPCVRRCCNSAWSSRCASARHGACGAAAHRLVVRPLAVLGQNVLPHGLHDLLHLRRRVVALLQRQHPLPPPPASAPGASGRGAALERLGTHRARRRCGSARQASAAACTGGALWSQSPDCLTV